MNMPAANARNAMLHANETMHRRAVDAPQERARSESASPAGSTEEKLRQVSEEFAGVFLAKMMKGMDNAGEWSDLGYGGTAEEIFRDLRWDKFAQRAATAGTGGLSDVVYEDLARKVYGNAVTKEVGA